MPEPDHPPPQPQDKTAERLIGGHYAIDFQRTLATAAPGHAAFAAIDRRSGRTDLMAVQVRPGATPRAQALNVLSLGAIESVLSPLAHGAATPPGAAQTAFVICRAPPGPPVWQPGAATQRPWPEAELLECLLRPAAEALAWLQSRHVTHRAIRPDNLFRAGPGQPVTLGSAWAAPPALLQPAAFEPPYVAMCLPEGRGAGQIADDVYALGVVLLSLALGRLPLAGLDAQAVIRRKLELGSYAALAGEERLPTAIADLVRGMLAEDPEHRPPPALLSDPAAARSRRVAARPPRRAQLALATPSGPVWNARTLAYAVACAPEHGARLLRSGEIDRWLRRGLGDSALAVRLDEVARPRGPDSEAPEGQADALQALRIVAVLDPLAPLCWRGLALWPDGLGPALLSPDASHRLRIGEMIEAEAISSWAAARPERGDTAQLAAEAHQLRATWQARGPGSSAARLRYALNPLLPCTSPNLAGRLVVRATELLSALEAAAATEAHAVLPIDAEIGAFLAARHEPRSDPQLARLGAPAAPEAVALLQLRLLATLQQRQRLAALPHLAAWLAEHVRPALAGWRHRQRRDSMTATFTEACQRGLLPDMLAVLDDPAQRASDTAGAREATLAVQAIDRTLAALAQAGPARARAARQIGQDGMLGLGLSALAVVLIAVLLG